MKSSTMIRAGAIAFAGVLAAAEPAHAALTLIAVGGGGGGAHSSGAGAGGVISESGTSGGAGGGAGGTGGLGGAGADAGGGAGWLGDGGSGTGGVGGLSAPTFAGGAGFLGFGNGGFGGGGGSGFVGGGGGGGYSGGGGGGVFGGGGGGGSYLNPALRDTIETPGFNGVPGPSASNGYVIVGLTVFNYTGTVVEYTIPTTGFYFVAAVGAQGGSFSTTGGNGAGVGGSVFLDTGTELNIVVGGAGMPDFASGALNGGGGGGSFVWDPTAIPVQSVAEPSTWAMMLLGFAGLGYAGFRRRVALAATAGPA